MSSDFPCLIKDPKKTVKSIVRKIAVSGETDLNNESLKELKQLCKSRENELIVVVFKDALKYLRKPHSQVRVAMVKLIDYLFQKSHFFRNLLLDDFDTFIELSLAITQQPKVKLKLPPPRRYAALLQELAAKCIYSWHSDYGSGYEKIRYAYKFLKQHRLVDFTRFRVRTHEDLIKEQKLAERQELALTRRIQLKLSEYTDLKSSIEEILAQIESLIVLIVPESSDISYHDDPQPSTSKDCTDRTIDAQQHGIATLDARISIQFNPYIELDRNQSNADLIENMRELKKQLIDVKLTKLIAIEKTISKRSDQFEDVIRDIIDLKTKSTNIIMKLAELRVTNDENSVPNEGDCSSESDEDFQDVEPKEDLELLIPKSRRHEYGLEKIDPRELSSSSSLTYNDEFLNPTPGCSTSETSLSLPCNVRLESGRMCPRRDKVKCPFHGKIIPRDTHGNPIDSEAREREDRASRKTLSVPDWQDPELLRDIKAATGIDLAMPKKGGKKTKTSKLANPKTCDTTPKQRLEKRLKLLAK